MNNSIKQTNVLLHVLVIAAKLVLGLLLGLAPRVAQSAQVVLNGPLGSGEFGDTVAVLPNGNFVVLDPLFDAPGPVLDVGAVYLYRANGGLISALTGSTANDLVGSGGVVVLASGNVVVLSPKWDNGSSIDAGAVTFISAITGVSGVVSASNSLVGTQFDDGAGKQGVTALSNGNYVVVSSGWDNGDVVDAGAVTFGSGINGIVGVISVANSLVGTSANDVAGIYGVTALGNGNYVVRSPNWDNGPIVDAGAVTFGSGRVGIIGAITPSNSLVGGTFSDAIGFNGVTALSTNNYVVASQRWDNGTIGDAGAVTFGSGTSGISGLVKPSNSLVGGSPEDIVGVLGVTALSNGNYVVRNYGWDNGSVMDAGAVTFGSGLTGITGVVSAGNSLVGTSAEDFAGFHGVVALNNGNYVVITASWDNGAIADVGAVTFGSGVNGVVGAISASNSLVGSTANDTVGVSGVTALSNGNYVVRSANWDNDLIIDAGAATFGSGTTGIAGVVSPSNSLVGSTASDNVAVPEVHALSNGNYVVASARWDNGLISDAGAATFGSGVTGISGVITASNSLVGSATEDRVSGHSLTPLGNGNYVVLSPAWNNGSIVDAGAATFGSGVSGVNGAVSAGNSLVGLNTTDRVGGLGATALNNGSYVVTSPLWDNGLITNAGAITFGSGATGISGPVLPSNSIVGSQVDDVMGAYGVTALSNGHYVVTSDFWDNGAIIDAGAVTLGLANGNVVGPITNTHSVLGSITNSGSTQDFAYDVFRNQLIVGLPASNQVILHRTGVATGLSIVGDAPDPSIDNQPVTFTATVNSISAPNEGVVTFRASGGEFCSDNTPAITSPTTADFSCSMTFTTNGASTVFAEYTGSINFAYGRSGVETHTANLVTIFTHGFE